MRFPRNVRIIRGQLDVAAFMGVLFLLVFFVMRQSSFIFTPGMPIRLPEVADVAGVTNATVVVAIDAHGHLYFENQVSTDQDLREKLRGVVSKTQEPLTLVVQADKSVTYDMLLKLGLLARDAGVKEALLAVRPRPVPRPLNAP